MARIDAMVNVHAHVTVSDANLAASGTRTRVRGHARVCARSGMRSRAITFCRRA